MESTDPQLIQKSQDNHRVERPTQTGFSSPATHYNEPRIDLNAILAPNAKLHFMCGLLMTLPQNLELTKMMF